MYIAVWIHCNALQEFHIIHGGLEINGELPNAYLVLDVLTCKVKTYFRMCSIAMWMQSYQNLYAVIWDKSSLSDFSTTFAVSKHRSPLAGFMVSGKKLWNVVIQCQDFLNFCCLVPNHHTLHRKESNLKNYFMTKNIERKY